MYTSQNVMNHKIVCVLLATCVLLGCVNVVAGNSVLQMWKVEAGEIIEIVRINYKAYKSDLDYIVQTELRTYYWLGRNTAKGDTGEAAAYAMVKAYKYRPKIDVWKEVEGQETDDFKALFRSIQPLEPDHDQNESAPNARIHKEVKANARRMFVIEEKQKNTHILNLKELGFSTHYVMQGQGNCFVFVLDKAYVSCQKNIVPEQKEAAETLAKIMMKRKRLNENNFEIIPRVIDPTKCDDDPQEIPIKYDEFTRAELRQILKQTQILKNGKERFSIQVSRIYQDDDGTVRSELPNPIDRFFFDKNLSLKKLNDNECYLADSRSNAGLFVWMGRSSNIYVRKGAAKIAERHLKRDPIYDYATQVTFIDPEDVPLNINNMRDLVAFLISQKESNPTQEANV